MGKRVKWLVLGVMLGMLWGGMTVQAENALFTEENFITKETFDYERYAVDYPDVAGAIGYDREGLWLHYQTAGKAEGRKAYSTSAEINGMLRAYRILGSIVNDSMSEREKVKAVHDWMCEHIDYDYDNYLNDTIPASSRNPDGVLSSGRAVCQGYAETFQVFMDILEIECELVSGTADNGFTVGGHAWNQVKVDGSWYNIDVTWDDPVYTYNGVRRQHTVYDYFLISNAQIGRDHTTTQAVHEG